MYQIQNTVPIVHQIREAQSMSTICSTPRHMEVELSGHEVPNPRSTNVMKHSFSSTKQEHMVWYRGMFGTMTLQKKSKRSQPANAVAKGKALLVSETAWTFIPFFVGYALELRYARSLGYISRSLNIYPVLSEDHTVFALCEEGDLSGLQIALIEKRVSPFVIDPHGWTLLHVIIGFPQLLA